MEFPEFSEKLRSLDEQGNFSFGLNWLDYVLRIGPPEIEAQQADLSHWFESTELKGRTVVDVGCGSGLSSLCLARAGASQVHSFDADPDSVRAANLLRSRHQPESGSWKIELGSILDSRYIDDLPRFDLVFSWGVLHHTGDLWRAIENAASLCLDGGILQLALYVSGPRYSEHLRQKLVFSLADPEQKKELLYRELRTRYFAHGIDVFAPRARGMTRFHDMLDWLGGLPYEVAKPSVLISYLKELGFELERFQDGREGSNAVFRFRRRSSATS